MSNENNKSIHDFDFNLICEFFSGMERQGPGSPEVTLKALSFIDNLTDQSLIADIGCGTGGQTMVLAQHAPGRITGIDLSQKFIDQFNCNAMKLNLQDRVHGIIGSMDDLPFQKEELDLIWSEGAIYNIGFERGLNEWRKYLPATCWTEHYFAPKIAAREIFLNKYAGNKTAEELIVSQRYEEELYRRYKEFYGYVFFIAKKQGND